MTDIPDQIDETQTFNSWLNIILTFQNGIYSGIVSLVAFIIFLKILIVNQRQEPFLLIIPILIGCSNICQCIPTVLVMPEIIDDPRGSNLADVLSKEYGLSIMLSSAFSVTSHWIFAIKYLSTAMVLPYLFSYIHINLLEDKFSDELNDLSA